MKQIIIVRKDLQMSPGKMSAQVSHASMAFLSHWIRNNIDSDYNVNAKFDSDIYDKWIKGIFTKVVLEAKNKNQLLKAIDKAKELGMVEGKDYFIIKDNCLTELEPEEIDENGIGRTITCIGFKPMKNEVIDQIGKKYQVYK